MDRRELLGAGGRALAGALGLGAFAGCTPRTDPNALVLRGWAYEPDLVRANLARVARFDGAQGVSPVDYAPVSGSYHDKMVAQFVARTALDLVYVRDDHFAEWVEAGWLQPIDAFPGAGAYQQEIFPFNWEAMLHNGKLYGLPYYSDFQIWISNRRMLEAAGIQECGQTLDEITEQCVRVKEKRVEGPMGVVEYPLMLGFKQALLAFNEFWGLMYASQAELFTPDLEPQFPDDPGRRAERVLQWMVDCVHKHKILDLELSFSTALARDPFIAGRSAMVAIPKYELQRVNDPGKSPVAGDAVMSLFPSLEPGQRGTVGWTRMYCLPTGCRYPERAWKLMELIGGRDPEGDYSTARFWYLERGLGFAFPALFDDPEVVRSTSRWGEIDKLREQAKYARAREVVKAPWFAEFDGFYQPEIQEILQGRVSPRDGLARIAAEVRRLRTEWA